MIGRCSRGEVEGCYHDAHRWTPISEQMLMDAVRSHIQVQLDIATEHIEHLDDQLGDDVRSRQQHRPNTRTAHGHR